MLCAVQARLAVGGLVFLDYHLLANALVARHLVDESIFSWLEIEEAKKAGGKFVRLSILIGAGSGVVILALTPFILKVITLNEQAQYYLKYMMFMAAYYIIGNALNSTVIGGIFPAGGDTKFGMICDIITLWGVVVPLGLIGAFVLKLPVLAVAFILTLDEFVKIPAVYLHYMKFKWVRNITKEIVA